MTNENVEKAKADVKKGIADLGKGWGLCQSRCKS
jgi:hypothetical protein